MEANYLQYCIGSGVNFGLEVSHLPEITEANNSNLDNDIFKLEILFVLFLKNIKKKQHAERSHILNALVEAYGKKKKKTWKMLLFGRTTELIFWKLFLLFSHSVVSDSLRPRGLHHARYKACTLKGEQKARCSGMGFTV